jgi:hypothetical protein
MASPGGDRSWLGVGGVKETSIMAETDSERKSAGLKSEEEEGFFFFKGKERNLRGFSL